MVLATLADLMQSSMDVEGCLPFLSSCSSISTPLDFGSSCQTPSQISPQYDELQISDNYFQQRSSTTDAPLDLTAKENRTYATSEVSPKEK